MTDLAEFLLARIAEDEARLRDVWVRPHWGNCNTQGDLSSLRDECDCGLPARVIADREAKRRIVERYRVCEPNYDEGNRLETRVLKWTMRLFAMAYADHPDYREEWKP